MLVLLLITGIFCSYKTSALNNLPDFLLNSIDTFRPKNVYLYLDQDDLRQNLRTCHKLHKQLWFVETLMTPQSLSYALSLETNYPNRTSIYITLSVTDPIVRRVIEVKFCSKANMTKIKN